MSDGTRISWTDATWNIITGCSVVSPGCTNCYAMQLAGTRLRHHHSRKGLTQEVNGNHVWTGETRFNEQWLDLPLRWKKPRMIFVCAHGDLFHETVEDEEIDEVFDIMVRAHWHTFQVLTKRPERMREHMRCAPWPLDNVWLGVSVEDQQRADERIPVLLDTPAAIRFLSIEPQLEDINIRKFLRDRQDTSCPEVHWVIQGCESGRNARPFDIEWARSLRDQCAATGAAYFLKQVMGPDGKKVETPHLDGAQHTNTPDMRETDKQGVVK